MASKTENIVADLSEIDLPDTTASARELFDLGFLREGRDLHVDIEIEQLACRCRGIRQIDFT